MHDLNRRFSLDILWELPDKDPIAPMRRLRPRARPLLVFATRIPFYLRPFRRFRILKTKNEALWLLHLTDIARRNEGKILSLFAGTDDASMFLEAHRRELEPFYCLYPKGAAHDS